MRQLLLFLGILMAGMANAQTQETKPVYYFNPDWSPDGATILFESTRDGKYAIYTIQVDGSNLRKLTNGEANDEQPRWSKDGRRVVFISDRDGHLQLYVMKADGSDQRRLTNATDIDYQPDFSPDGDHVAFISRADKASMIHDIYMVRTDGTGRIRLTDQSANDTSPRWSPNGKKILFERSPIIKRNYRDMSKEDRDLMRRSQEIFVMDKGGANAKNLTNNQTLDCCAQWSKDGKTIYFLSDRDGASQVYAMNADGSKVRKVADGNIVRNPNASRDGKHFAYTKEVKGQWGLYLYDIKSGQERLLIGNK